ncbi:ribonucleoside-diphosphate reductase subunit alpha [Helicobacter ailurogastricus]|uniref:Ribonucleoside-diphosphate reductase n=1 Tax=Helicobacter ailurogastricus TaxID=1578720 RepID=A0A0K2X991_9HELI|nr:ribonucleoside-diphosphate reductase subunit alpha [Helicobacter ailurogastricus]CRF40684.1 Ribonucleotide reductase of class Ia (aerobic), alpha subunit [Helicobacter ailurogastricus]CRF43077.1 Ribonucleotide reductase of class Ia (aerobic), alpha subunit [Helicobacter ailurogastricus]CRF44306.1 Ribonucleotide reductase of class Ia (aerobic), alpha subunit [Helicobacter ailurogastricus]
MEMTATKRNERTDSIDMEKIRQSIQKATEGIEGINTDELEAEAQLYFKDSLGMQDVAQALIRMAVDKIDVDAPNWSFVAARLFLEDLYEKVSGFQGYLPFKKYLELGESKGRIVRGFKEKFDLDLLNKALEPKRDLQFNYLGIKTLHDRYLLKDEFNHPIELPQHMFMAIAMFLAQNESDPNEKALEFYGVLSRFEMMCATPTLANARTPNHQLSSCYVGSTPDNIEGIFDSYKDMALLSKYGGGIGWDFSQVRCLGSYIDGHKSASAGVIPFLKIVNDVAIAVDQLGTRKGAIAVYLEVWHMDILEFIDLRKNSGDERRRAHDLFPALWICDLFMERVENDEMWSLFDPYTCKDLTECYGVKFKEKYLAYEQNPHIGKEKISARTLWKRILTNYFESGLPFLGFKDSANHANPNAHVGMIRSSNLCTEIYQNTSSSHYKVQVDFTDGARVYFEEEDLVCTDAGIEKKANKLTSNDFLNGQKIFMATKVPKEGTLAVCNLASLNLSKINTPKDIERVVPIAVRMLDNVIDLNFYPTTKAKRTNLKSRAIGLGVMGEAQMLAQAQIAWGSQEHAAKVDALMEKISYETIKASSALAKERGSYAHFEGSEWSRGIFPIDKAKLEALEISPHKSACDWAGLKAQVQTQGLRNGYLMAIAPTSSISILVGTTQTIEPIYQKKWFEENLSGMIPVVVPNLNLDTWSYYTSAYDVDPKDIVRLAAVRQKWIDQGQSLNLFLRLDKANGKLLHEIYHLAWKLGLKSTYYLRTQSPHLEEKSVFDRSIECHHCQ